MDNFLHHVKVALFTPVIIHEKVLVAKYFSCWCILILDDQGAIINKFWGEEDKILKCFSHYVKTGLFHPGIICKKSFKAKTSLTFKMDKMIRDCWFDSFTYVKA